MQVTTLTPPGRRLEFGIYRDGDNNLDASQSVVVDDAVTATAKDPSIGVYAADTTRAGGALHTDLYDIADGSAQGSRHAALDMADPRNLAKFVAQTLDRAEASGATQTWIDLVDHGGGDGGGLETDSKHHIMSMPAMAGAIAAGEAMHAHDHPEDAARKIDGVVANQCLMSTMAFADALSHAGVKYLAASPETMLSPGTPTSVANAIARDVNDPNAMARDVVGTVMHTQFHVDGERFGPAAAFDVLDLGAAKMNAAVAAIKSLNDAIASPANGAAEKQALREDVKSVEGMVRFPEATPDMPWHSDRPAIAVYDTLAQDARLPDALRADAQAAAAAVGNLILAHGESKDFGPFGSDYRDAVGPTIHTPVTAKQLDPWAPAISETHNRFFDETDAAAAERVLA